ncbi:glycoside hydrolase family protein [Flavobacterium tyrosinilyticum]|uniref:glycoside hydrolase family protein n=1 Tax=Flavobacterium tyrosinilyticum TaxID=1658740 RepID=UPI00202EF87F|nr:glycoside hydrolase family protein [Flavobacterium tyrosinilyticum]MCM0666438.1 glycoside hydrolase family protein [Flavobacterium tyrosinilyticum]
MSDFKIIGNPDPVVGKEEFYSVNTFLPSILPFQNSASSNSFEQPVKWEIYILENGRWRKTKENDKTGKRISYTFLQKSLERKGIRILARRGEDVARFNVTTHPAEKPKIESIELLDKNGQKPKKALSYGQTLKARVHCLHMEKHKVSVTLWEDDAAGAGHNKANEKNIIQTLSGVVKNGKADVDFLLKPSFAKIANKSKDEGKIHEYYVTTDFNKDKIASNNVNVNDLETPVAPFKGKVPVQQQAPTKPKASLPQPTQPKTKAPATGSSSAPKVKAEITRVHITNSAKQPIKGTHKEKEIIVWVDSQGLIGKEIRFKLYDEDYLSNDLLVDQKFKITGDIFPITVHLDKILRSKGGISGEGAEQELFADVEVIQTSIHSKSEVVDVDAKVFKPDPVEVTNKVAKTGEGDKNDGKNCGEKHCINKNSPASELIREINIRLAGFGGNVPTDKFTDRTEKMIKQFQRDYMKVPETGKVCGNVLLAIDDFSKKFDITTRFWNQMKCDCSKKGQITTSKLRRIRETNLCSGFGDHTGKSTYKDSPHNEANHNYEYPGIHRSLLFGVKALQFYFSKQTVYTMDQVTSGYRCRFKNYKTTNHQGKAIDIQFSKSGTEIRGPVRANLQKLRDIRDEFYIKYLGAQKNWPDSNLFSTEPIDLLYYPDGSLRYDYTFSWLHVDVRQFDSQYLEDKYFCKSLNALNGKSIVEVAKESGYLNTCNCKAVLISNNSNSSKSTSEKNRVDPKTLKASDELIKFMKDWEKYKRMPYNDSKDFCTIGYGHLIEKKKCEQITIPDEFKNGISEEQAKELFRKDLKVFEKAVQKDVTVKLYQREFDALVDLLFNCGPYFLSLNKAPKLYKNLLEEKYEEAAKEFLDIENKKRRQQNYEIFINGNYDSKH